MAAVHLNTQAHTSSRKSDQNTAMERMAAENSENSENES